MPKRKDSFSRALADAKSRLTKCHAQREATRKLLTTLDIEIPLLQHTVAALECQLNPTGTKLFNHVAIPGVINEVMASMPDGTNLTEDDTLPDVEGTPVVPEE